MANSDDNILLRRVRGAIGKQVVIRQFNNQTVMGSFPDMSGVKPSKNQTKRRKIFAEAVAYSKSAKNYTDKQLKYKSKDNFSVYHAAIKDFMTTYSGSDASESTFITAAKTWLEQFSLSDQQVRSIIYINEQKKLTNKNYQRLNGVSKATATRHLQEMAELNIISFNGGKGAGAFFTAGPWLSKNRLI